METRKLAPFYHRDKKYSMRVYNHLPESELTSGYVDLMTKSWRSFQNGHKIIYNNHIPIVSLAL